MKEEKEKEEEKEKKEKKEKKEEEQKKEEQKGEENESEHQISLLEKWQNQMNLIQEKTGIKGIFVILGLFLSVLFVYFNIFDSIITNLVGTLYPLFWTIKSLEQNQIEEQKKWLIYWVVFGFFIIVDMSSIIIAKLIPFYLVVKILFLMWLFMPGSGGCEIVYYFVVKKIFRYYEDTIVLYVDGAKDYANDLLNDNKLKNFHNKNLIKKNHKDIGDKEENIKEGDIKEESKYNKQDKEHEE